MSDRLPWLPALLALLPAAAVAFLQPIWIQEGWNWYDPIERVWVSSDASRFGAFQKERVWFHDVAAEVTREVVPQKPAYGLFAHPEGDFFVTIDDSIRSHLTYRVYDLRPLSKGESPTLVKEAMDEIASVAYGEAHAYIQRDEEAQKIVFIPSHPELTDTFLKWSSTDYSSMDPISIDGRFRLTGRSDDPKTKENEALDQIGHLTRSELTSGSKVNPSVFWFVPGSEMILTEEGSVWSFWADAEAYSDGIAMVETPRLAGYPSDIEINENYAVTDSGEVVNFSSQTVRAPPPLLEEQGVEGTVGVTRDGVVRWISSSGRLYEAAPDGSVRKRHRAIPTAARFWMPIAIVCLGIWLVSVLVLAWARKKGRGMALPPLRTRLLTATLWVSLAAVLGFGLLPDETGDGSPRAAKSIHSLDYNEKVRNVIGPAVNQLRSLGAGLAAWLVAFALGVALLGPRTGLWGLGLRMIAGLAVILCATLPYLGSH